MGIPNKIKCCISKSDYYTHETKRTVLIRFLLVAGILVLYFIFVSLKYGLYNGFRITLLSWSFFVFCTPIADAGFLLDFPVRLITKIKMIYSEMFVWITAFLINLYSIVFNPIIYEKIEILRLFKYILLHPFPFWAIIVVSAIGTFISIYFGDELINVVRHKHRKKYKKHKNKYTLILILFIIIFIILMYRYLLGRLGIEIPGA